MKSVYYNFWFHHKGSFVMKSFKSKHSYLFYYNYDITYMSDVIKIHILHCGQVKTIRWLPFNKDHVSMAKVSKILKQR